MGLLMNIYLKKYLLFVLIVCHLLEKFYIKLRILFSTI